MDNRDMEERLDNILLKLVELAELQINEAIEKKVFNKDIAESTAISLSMAYERWIK
ncbi:MAG: hypothetical protein RR806_08395 [Oscillospiraceae bacterium]